jgi:hypothetical protein
MDQQSEESMRGFGATDEEVKKATALWNLLRPALKLAESEYPVSYPIIALDDWGTRSPLGLYRVVKAKIFTEGE